MKKLFFIPAVLFFASCTTNTTKPVEVAEDRIEITPFLVNRVILRDTAKVNNVYHALIDVDSARVPMYAYESMMSQPARYLDNVQFNQLKTGLQVLMNDPRSKVYEYPGGKALDRTEVKNIFFKCDSIIESSFDNKGNETIKKSFACDSTSVFLEICRIDFYETWYFNKTTNMIDKEILGYSVHRFVNERNAFMQLCSVMRDEEAIKKWRKYYDY